MKWWRTQSGTNLSLPAFLKMQGDCAETQGERQASPFKSDWILITCSPYSRSSEAIFRYRETNLQCAEQFPDDVFGRDNEIIANCLHS
jgi:hypothetical protein